MTTAKLLAEIGRLLEAKVLTPEDLREALLEMPVAIGYAEEAAIYERVRERDADRIGTNLDEL